MRYGAGGPKPDLIETGNGGNPFAEAGWTGWFALDNGYDVRSNQVLVGPCSQTGVLGVFVDGAATAPPIEQCETETDFAALQTKALRASTSLTLSSSDNRAVTLSNPPGALIKLTVPLGEPGSVVRARKQPGAVLAERVSVVHGGSALAGGALQWPRPARALCARLAAVVTRPRGRRPTGRESPISMASAGPRRSPAAIC